MADFTERVDIFYTIYQTVGDSSALGLDSKYAINAHPGTGNVITGWKWDERMWPTPTELELEYTLPTLYDQPFWDAVETDWQAGIGHGEDLFVDEIYRHYTASGECWLPEVKHGYFYIENNEYYLHSDGLDTNYFSGIVDSGNFQYRQLDYMPKPTIPITVKNYIYNSDNGRYSSYYNFRKKNDFSGIVIDGEFLSVRDNNDNLIHANISRCEPEFIVEYENDDPPIIRLNGMYPIHNRHDITVSGIAGHFEIIGQSNASENQAFNTLYSPICPSSGMITVCSFTDTACPVSWNVLTGINEYPSGLVNTCYIDHDLGVINFGDGINGNIPGYGEYIAIQYSGQIAIYYEAENTTDYTNGLEADCNTLHGMASQGFVHIRNDLPSPGSVVLEADLPEISADLYGPLYLGFSSAKLTATVYGFDGETIEGENVLIEIIAPTVGSFGAGITEIEVITDIAGEAITYYCPPTTVDELGDATDQITSSGGITVLSFDGLPPVDDNNQFFTYKIMKTDPILGIQDSSIQDYYEDYFTDEQIPYASLTTEIGEEGQWRATWDLPTPATYTPEDLETGAKVAILVYDIDALNPHTGTRGAYTMLQPLDHTVTGTTTDITYSGILDPITTSGDFKAYFVATSTQVQLRASIYNSVIKRRIYSNTITINIDIPESMNGLYAVDALSSLPSGLLNDTKSLAERTSHFNNLISGGIFVDNDLENIYQKEQENIETRLEWLERTRRGDNALIGLKSITTSETGAAVIPLGFKLRNGGLTMASALDGVTFLDPNDTSSGIYV